MARKSSPAKASASTIAPAVQKANPNAGPQAVTSTPVRNSAIPKVAGAVATPASTYDMIAVRAFEISCGSNRGSEQENWYRAEQELRGA